MAEKEVVDKSHAADQLRESDPSIEPEKPNILETTDPEYTVAIDKDLLDSQQKQIKRDKENDLTTSVSALDEAVRRSNAIESDRAYREIAKDIISKTNDQLQKHTAAKKPLRWILMGFITTLLFLQFAFLIVFLLGNHSLDLQISDYVINVYIVSVFVETLAGLIIMIKFAFDSSQEIELIAILNSIIQNFKKFDDK